jgi:hypothetical protein
LATPWPSERRLAPPGATVEEIREEEVRDGWVERKSETAGVVVAARVLIMAVVVALAADHPRLK